MNIILLFSNGYTWGVTKGLATSYIWQLCYCIAGYNLALMHTFGKDIHFEFKAEETLVRE